MVYEEGTANRQEFSVVGVLNPLVCCGAKRTGGKPPTLRLVSARGKCPAEDRLTYAEGIRKDTPCVCRVRPFRVQSYLRQFTSQ